MRRVILISFLIYGHGTGATAWVGLTPQTQYHHLIVSGFDDIYHTKVDLELENGFTSTF